MSEVEEEIELAQSLNPKPNGPCSVCKQRPATLWWTEGTIAYVHGMKQARCERCCVEEQLKFARERAAVIPELERRLARIAADTRYCLWGSGRIETRCDKPAAVGTYCYDHAKLEAGTNGNTK